MSGTRAARIHAYHHDSKHRLEGYAPGPGGLDWANQPEPFRSFVGAEVMDLPLGADGLAVPFARIRAGQRPPPAPVDLAHVAILLELALGLSAWKAYGSSRWALRCNPSSGNLHPTEGYLITRARPGVAAGVYHYLSRDHRLERRATIAGAVAPGPAPRGVAVALTSIPWREAWKYGLRAYRYCQLDVGHALGALAYAAAVLGWRVTPLAWSDAVLAAVLGLARAEEFHPRELEVPELALWVGPDSPTASADLIDAARCFAGVANRLSHAHRDWPGIAEVQRACERPAGGLRPDAPAADDRPPLPSDGHQPAAGLIRQRRSAIAFDGRTHLPAARWLAILDALMPRRAVPPLDAWPWIPRVHLALFVHRVDGIDPGLYLMARDPAAIPRLRAGLRPDWLWAAVPGAPRHLPLLCLARGDTRAAARELACHQDIAADGCFAVAMLADFDASLQEAPWRYRELFWECGLIGQVLYLEAEAAGIRGTGIGCFFDDSVHALLGITDTRWQSLYHFTAGAPVDDPRLLTEPPYAGRGERMANTRIGPSVR